MALDIIDRQMNTLNQGRAYLLWLMRPKNFENFSWKIGISMFKLIKAFCAPQFYDSCYSDHEELFFPSQEIVTQNEPFFQIILIK